MSINVNVEKLCDMIRETRPFFMNHEEASDVHVKGRADFVTAVDIRVQEYLQKILENEYPEVQFMGEEKDNSDIDFSGAVWILDPVDGTTNLIHDYRDSAVSLGLCEQGSITLGIIYQPFSDELFAAQKGKGAFCNGNPIHVSKVSKLENSLVAVGTSPYHRELTDANFDMFRRIYDRCVDIRRMGAASMDLAYVACGRAEAYVERNLKPWDFAAGKLLVEEAGGKVIDFSGREACIQAPSDIIAGNGIIEDILYREIISRQ